MLEDSSPTEVEKTLQTLGRLGGDPHSMSSLSRRPELAGLLAEALEADPDGPAVILDSIPPDGTERCTAILSLYGLMASPRDSVTLAKVLRRDGDIIERLCLHHVWDAVRWFYQLPSDPEAEKVYRSWLQSIFEQALDSPDDDALDRARTFLTIHVSMVNATLDADADFRRRFLQEVWPLYHRVLSAHRDETEWGMYNYDPRVWAFLAQYGQRGAKMFDARGAIAVDLLAAREYQGCRERVWGALESGDQETIAALNDPKLREQALFRKLLERDLPAGTLAKALNILASDVPSAPKNLRYYYSLDDATLTEELGPPPEGPETWLPGYSIYYLARKFTNGREITGMDTVMATVDAVEAVFMMKGASKGLKVIQKGVKTTLEKRGAGLAARQAHQATARELFPWVIRSGHEQVRLAFASIGHGTKADITSTVQFMFRGSGLGNESFWRLTGLEAKVFMRADRRVIIDLGELGSNRHVLGRYLRETAFNAGFDGLMVSGEAALKTETGAEVARSTKTGAIVIVKTSGDEIEAWKQHLSAWWLANAVGTVDHLAAKGK
jgi:hypothetical protein